MFLCLRISVKFGGISVVNNENKADFEDNNTPQLQFCWSKKYKVTDWSKINMIILKRETRT